MIKMLTVNQRMASLGDAENIARLHHVATKLCARFPEERYQSVNADPSLPEFAIFKVTRLLDEKNSLAHRLASKRGFVQETASHFALSHGNGCRNLPLGASRYSVFLRKHPNHRLFSSLGLADLLRTMRAQDDLGGGLQEKATRHMRFYYPIAERIGKRTFLDYFSRDELSNAIQATAQASRLHHN